MHWLGVLAAAVGAAALVLGAAALRSGWTLPWTRGTVLRPQLYGLGGVLFGVACLGQGLFSLGVLPAVSRDVRLYAMSALLLCGLLLIGVSQMPRTARRRG
ncbi:MULTISPECIES: hypothetical protein [unclassified Streptomyces]|uniref:hypothetical protein n=1 Tax=Streptomyces TaxID=1883 RepID=UPI0034012537